MQDLGIGEDLIEALAGEQPRVAGQAKPELPDDAELLHLHSVLVQLRAGERWCSCRGMLLVNRAHSTGTLSQLVPRAGSAPPILATVCQL